MSKVAIVYWSGTGNTEQMAESVADGARNAGADVTTFTAAEFDADKMDEFDAIASNSSILSAPMDGEMVSGCATGMRPAAMTVL